MSTKISLEERENINQEILELKNMILRHLGGGFKLDEVVKLRNVYITEDFLNELEDTEGESRKFMFGNTFSVCRESIAWIERYMKLVIQTTYRDEHTMVINHIIGFIIIDTDSLRFTTEINISSTPEDIGHLIGKGGSSIFNLKNNINKILEEAGVKERVKFVKAHKMSSSLTNKNLSINNK